jgi:hypothetical protein
MKSIHPKQYSICIVRVAITGNNVSSYRHCSKRLTQEKSANLFFRLGLMHVRDVTIFLYPSPSKISLFRVAGLDSVILFVNLSISLKRQQK